MKILEITNKARKQIKLLRNHYFSYIINKSAYLELSDMIEALKKSDDQDIIREVDIINQKLNERQN